VKLTEAMKQMVETQRLGFVATVGADGAPNLSPKGTFAVLDDERLGYIDLRSPGTGRNIAAGSAVEVNFVDPFSRKGFRFFGRAVVLKPGEPDCQALFSRIERWSHLGERMRALVAITVERAGPLISPAYDQGADEASQRRQWAEYFRAQQPGGRWPD
jgi:predicted pyridoxine 5'-phosphate oxidase superfamily flavin-nucleotide-binding protein